MSILVEENKLCSQKARGYSQNDTAREVTVTSLTGTQDELNKKVLSILKNPGCGFLRNKPNAGKLIILKKFNKQTFVAQDLSDCYEKVNENVNFLSGDTFPF